VTLSGTKLVIQSNVFHHLGGLGLVITAGSSSITVNGNVFQDLSGGGIAVGGTDYRTPLAQCATGTAVSNNLVTQVGAQYEGAVGILIGYATSTAVNNNEVSYTPYTGISVGASQDDGGCAADNAEGGTSASNNLIYKVMLVTTDGAGIYTQGGRNNGSGFLYNYIHDVGRFDIVVPGGSPFNVLLYHDSSSYNFQDVGNVLANGVNTPCSIDGGVISTIWLLNKNLGETITGNYVQTDDVMCPGGSSYQCYTNQTTVSSAPPPWTVCDFDGGSQVYGTIVADGGWPADAQAIIDAAGVQPPYSTSPAYLAAKDGGPWP
jgi:hypothetical protein